jgi:hypothetical protein
MFPDDSHKPWLFETELPKGLMATDGMRATGLDQELISSKLRPWWFNISFPPLSEQNETPWTKVEYKKRPRDTPENHENPAIASHRLQLHLREIQLWL